MSRNTWTKYLNYAKCMVVSLGCVCVCVCGGGAHLRAKGLVRTRGGGGVSVIFKKYYLFPICIIQKLTILAQK